MSQTAASPARPADRTHGLGRIGVWSLELRFGDKGAAREATAELEQLGYGAIWTPGGIGGPFLEDLSGLLDASGRIAIAAGILNIYKHEPAEVGAWWAGLGAARQARVMLGLGVSHGPVIGQDYQKPLATMHAYLDGLDAAGVPAERRCLAALGPKMLELARDRTAGAHPYLVTPEHTAEARSILGEGVLLAPEQGVVLEADPARAREIARKGLETYLQLPNYRNSWKRQGYTEQDIAEVSDRLVDGVIAWGTPEQVAARVRAHLDAGADHVCVQVIGGAARMAPPLQAWRALAEVLI